MNTNAINPEVVAKHITALVGVTVTAKKGLPTDLKGKTVVCVIDNEATELACLILFDFAAAGGAGAALSRIPPAVVKDATVRNTLDENLLENFHEIANVLTVLTTAALGQRSILRGVKQGKDSEEPGLKAFIAKATTKICIQLAIQGYPSGHCAFLFA